MVDISQYGEYKTSWCPGCGNFPLLKAVKQALVRRNLEPHQVLLVSGIGQAAKAPHYMNANIFNGLHGRASGGHRAKLANPGLVVIAESGDGCMYSEGGNHFLAAIRRNVDITLLAHNNQVYGLTKGQASPLRTRISTKAQPKALRSPLQPIGCCGAMHAGFVGRGYVGLEDELVDLLVQAINHRGFSLVDILHPAFRLQSGILINGIRTGASLCLLLTIQPMGICHPAVSKMGR